MINRGHCYLLERLANILLVLALANFLIILSKGGYDVTLGPLQLSAHHLAKPLSLCLALAMARVWLRGKKMGIPIAVRLRSPLLLFLSVVLIYSLNGRTLLSGDAAPARYLPFSIVREFDFDLDEFTFLYEPEVPYFLKKSHGHVVSAYPPWAAVLALPVYFLPVIGGLSPQSHLVPELEKLAAVLITAFSVVILFLALRRMTEERIAWCVALVYALGTSSFSSSGQALWQHGPSQLFLALTIYYLVRGMEQSKFSAYAGFALAGAIICRPMNLLMALPIGAYILHKRHDRLIGFLVATLPLSLMFMAYNYYYFGAPFTTGFAASVVSPSSIGGALSHLFPTPLFEGVMGVMASPGRGLLIYSPILFFSFVGMAMVWRAPGQALLRYLSLAVLPFILLTGKWAAWWGGHSYGPRLLADLTPILCLYLYPLFQWSEPKAFLRYTLAGLSALSIGLHALGAVCDGSWNNRPNEINAHTERLWSWVDSPPRYYTQQIAAHAFSKLKQMALSLPTSLHAPQKLGASYSLVSPADGLTLSPSQFVDLRVDAHNTGEAVWLAHARGDKGTIRLGWRWLKGDQEFPSLSGRHRLSYDVFPGQSYMFMCKITPPADAGDYILEVGLVSELVTWFHDQGVKPVRISIRVLKAR